MARKKNDKIEVEVEVGDREIEIEIDPATGEMTVTEEEDSEDESPDKAARDNGEEKQPARKRGPGLVLGVIVGGLAGAAGAVALVRQLAARPSEAAQAIQNAPEGPSQGLIGSVQARWREATLEGRIASQQAEREKLARYQELTGDEPK